MAVKRVTIEFDSVDEALVALARFADPAAVKVGPIVPQPVASKPDRKGRADKGVPRGPRTPAAQPPQQNAAGASMETAAPPSATAGNSTPVVPDASKAAEQAANSTSTPTAAPNVTATAATATTAPAAPSGKPASDQEAQDALEALFNATDFMRCAAVLNEFGVTRAKDLKPEQRADFIAKAKAAAEKK